MDNGQDNVHLDMTYPQTLGKVGMSPCSITILQTARYKSLINELGST